MKNLIVYMNLNLPIFTIECTYRKNQFECSLKFKGFLGFSSNFVSGSKNLETVKIEEPYRANPTFNSLIPSSSPRSTVAYLSADATEAGLSPELTALQCLNFYRLLHGAVGVSSLEAEAILQELGLDATKHCLVSSLTCSESRRLALACRLIEGTQILSLDRPTRGLDIFDAFFLVEYLRQWALRAQRLVLLTLHPPTYEILTMLSRVTLTSGGRTMYSGSRRDMLPYFALAEFPCPPFKNPSDYYRECHCTFEFCHWQIQNLITHENKNLLHSRPGDAGRPVGRGHAGILAAD